MKTPKHVLQQDPLGCLGATMAMVLGITYEAACDLMGGRPREKHSFYCDVWDQTLEDNGWAVCRRWVTKQPGNVKRDPWPLEPWADLHECEVQTSMIHSVLLLRDGTVLDPLTPEPKRLSDYNGVLSMAALYNVAHLQSQLDECRRKRDEAKEQVRIAGIHAEERHQYLQRLLAPTPSTDELRDKHRGDETGLCRALIFHCNQQERALDAAAAAMLAARKARP